MNGVPSSVVVLGDPARLDFEYVRWTADVLDALRGSRSTPAPLRAVHVGGAGCTLPRWLDEVRPGSRQTVLEVDGALVELARTSFALPPPPALRIRVADGRTGLAREADGTVDVLVRDAFDGPQVPAHLMTSQWHGEVARVLGPAGVYIANVADRPPGDAARVEAVTAATAMPHVAMVGDPGQMRGRRYGNVLVVASRAPLDDVLDLGRLVHRLSSGTWRARLVEPTDVVRLVAGVAPLHD